MKVRNHPAILVHVGYPKCGSTWLQDELFERPGTGFVSLIPHRDILQLLLKLVDVDPFFFDPAPTKALLEERMKTCVESGLVPVLSHEGLLSSAWDRPNFKGKEICDRLAAVLPNAKILIIIREQSDIILSYYRHFVRNGGWLTLKQFLYCR